MDLSTMLQQMLMGLGNTILVFVLTLVFALPFGLVVARGRMAKNAIVRNLVKVYISIMRGTPLMLQLFVWYFAKFYLTGTPTPPKLLAVILAYVFNYAAYFAEIYRSGIQSMPAGQYEAAAIMGYSRRQTFQKIILPQVFKNVLPAITNEVITLVKDTSLAYSISYLELFNITTMIASAQTTITPFIIAAIFYYVFNYVVSFIMERIEKHFDYYK